MDVSAQSNVNDKRSPQVLSLIARIFLIWGGFMIVYHLAYACFKHTSISSPNLLFKFIIGGIFILLGYYLATHTRWAIKYSLYFLLLLICTKFIVILSEGFLYWHRTVYHTLNYFPNTIWSCLFLLINSSQDIALYLVILLCLRKFTNNHTILTNVSDR